MTTFFQIMALIGAGLIGWILYTNVSSHPEQFSRENLNKSFSTMAILAIVLIVFVAFLVFMVRQSS